MENQINHLLVLTGMSGCTPKDNPSIKTPLVTDIDINPCKETDKWSYADIVGMLQYLSSTAWTDIKLAAN